MALEWLQYTGCPIKIAMFKGQSALLKTDSQKRKQETNLTVFS